MTSELFRSAPFVTRRLQFTVGWGDGDAVRAFPTLKAARAYARDCDWIGRIKTCDRVALKIERDNPERNREIFRMRLARKLFGMSRTVHHAAILIAAFADVPTRRVEDAIANGNGEYHSHFIGTGGAAGMAADILEKERRLAFIDEEVGGLVSMHKGRKW